MEENKIEPNVEENEKNYLEDLQRLQAEFENYSKRNENEKNELLKYSNEKLITNMLGILDSFDLALKYNKDEGVQLIYSELMTLLESQGLSKINCEGKFDPNLHEALMQEEGKIDEEIIEELQSGYKLNEKVIRPAKVKITRVKNE